MNEEIIKVLDELGKRFGIVLDWSNQNIISYLQELLRRFILYRNITACIFIILIVMIIIGVVLVKFLNKWIKSDSYNEDYWSDDMLATMGYIFQ